jgi:cyanophycin synthetase
MIQIMQLACQKLRLPYRVKNDTLHISYNGHTVQFNRLYNDINSAKSKQNTIDKHSTFKMLQTCKLPVPKQVILKIGRAHTRNYISIQYPVVVKPIDGTAGQYVYVNIKNMHALQRIIDTKFKLDTLSNSYTVQKGKKPEDVIVEDYLVGNDYRIICYKKHIIDIVERIKPFIIGDGKHTLSELVAIENRHRRKKHQNVMRINVYYVRHTLGLSKTYIPKFKERVIINPMPAGCHGGITRRVPLNRVHPDNIKCFQKVNSCLGLTFSGIDFISPNISHSYKTTRSGINEVNSSPDLKLHYMADDKRDISVPVNLLKLCFNL